MTTDQHKELIILFFNDPVAGETHSIMHSNFKKRLNYLWKLSIANPVGEILDILNIFN